MFDMNHTGSVIAERRRAKNMTQMELADALNISYQAVSNWERGVSMPDISKLPELAELLEVSIDELLGKKSSVIEDVLNDGAFCDATAEEIEEALPILKATQLDTIAEKAADHLNGQAIRSMIPYLAQNIRDALFRKMLEQGDAVSARSIISYISRETVDRCFIDGLGDASLMHFSGNEGLNAGTWHYYCQNGCGRDLRRYLALLKERGETEIPEKIALAEYEANGTENLRSIVFHLTDEVRHKLACRIIENEGIEALAPIIFWLDKEKLESVIREKYI